MIVSVCGAVVVFFFFKQKTAYEMRISDWSSDVCSSDLRELLLNQTTLGGTDAVAWASEELGDRVGVTVLASGHSQERSDRDDDGWADLPRYRRAVDRKSVV